ncbi:MAG: CARDB domain-containing protein, partial [Methanomassiliicoccales archaeon]
MRYNATISYLNVTSVSFDEMVAVSFDQFPELNIMDLQLDVVMDGLYLDKPDLVLVNPGHTPTTVYNGESGATVNVTVINNGVTAAQYIVVQVLDIFQGRTTIIANVTIPALDADDSMNVIVPWTSNLNGSHEIKFIVDPDDTILEASEINNMVSHYVTVLALLPDLSVSDDEIDFSMFPAMTGMPLTIDAIVRNTDGRATAVNATVSFYLGQPTVNGILIGTTKVTVSAGGQVAASLTWTPNVVGQYTIYVVVGGIIEYDYTNNTASSNLRIYVSESGQLEVNDTVGTMYINENRYEQQNIIVRENGTLIINATIFFNQDEANQYWVIVQDNGTLVLNSNGLLSSYNPLTVYLAEDANLTISGASAQSNSQITIVADDNSTLYITNSGIGYDFIAPSTSEASLVAIDTTFIRTWSYFGGNAKADLTSIAIPSLTPSDTAEIRHYRWIEVTTYDGTGSVKLSGVYVELKSWNNAIPTYYASGISDSTATFRFKALCDVLSTATAINDYGNYKVNGTYWYDGNRADSLTSVEVSLIPYSTPLSISNAAEKLVIPVTLTDVSIVAADIKFSPTSPVTNQTATVSVTVRNLGSQAADGTQVSLYLNTTGVAELIAIRTISNLPGGLGFTVNIPWTPEMPGVHLLEVILDEDLDLNETTRGNNEAAVTTYVLDVPHIYTSDISFYLGTGTTPITQATVGNMVRISAMLINDGESAASDFTVSFWLNAPLTGTLISTVPVSQMLAGENTTVSTNWEATSVSGGGAYQNRTVYVTINNAEYTLETDEPQSQVIQIVDNRPDLIVKDDVVVTKGTLTVTEASLGERIKIWFNVSNVGMSTANNAAVKVNLTLDATSVELSLFTVTLQPGETKQYNVTYLVSGIALGAYELNIWANPGTTFKEASATNNHFVTDFSIVVLEDPVITIMLQTSGQTEFEPGDKITVSGSIMSRDGLPIVNQTVRISLRDSQGFSIGAAQTRTTDAGGWFITILNISPDYDEGDAYVTATINDGAADVSGSVKIKITSDTGLPIPLWLILLIIVVIVLVIVFFSWYLYRYSLGKMVECGECGSLIPEASKRCPKCGTIFETGTAKCSECGAWIPANAP